MTIDFQEHFWGEKQNGFDILYQNLKCASTSAKELTEFLRSRAVIEEYNFNLLIKLSRKTNNQQFGTFNPLWLILKTSTEKLSNLHMQTLQRFNQLIKDVTKYCDEHHKKQKQIKTEETSTIEAINELKETIAALNKTKEFYYTKTVEVDRLKRENASQKDIEKAEARVNKACVEYKNLVEKHRKSKNDYEKKFRLSCKNFQKLEEDHIKQMKDYLTIYFQILDSGHALIGQVYKEFQNNCKEMTIERLLEQFIKSKGTGSTQPADVQFEDVNTNNFQLNMPQVNASNVSTALSKTVPISNYTSSADLINLDLMPPPSITNLNAPPEYSTTMDSNFTNSNTFEPSSSNNLRKEGFLRSKKDKTKDRRMSKRDSDGESNNGSISSSKMDEPNGNGNNDFIIDSEGFTVRPAPAQKETDNFYSSSDSDSDSEDEKEKKIFVKINPLQNGTQISASVDQLIASVGALTLAPTNQSSRRTNLSANPSPVQNDGSIKRSVSATHTAFKNDQSDLFDIFSTQANSTVNSNIYNHKNNTSGLFANSFDPLANLQKSNASLVPKAPESKMTNSSSNNRYAELSDLFLMSSNNDKHEAADTKSTAGSNNETSSNILPLPPKTNSESSFNAFSVSNSSLSKSVSSTSIMGSTMFSVYKPLSKSFASSHSSNGMMSRADSVSSLSSDFRMTPISLCSSRDSSPLTIGMSDSVPIAIAFQESVGACFKGADENLCKINIIGCIKIAFSSGIIQGLSSNPYLQQLSFKLKNINRLDRIILSKELISQTETNENFTTYEMNMSTLQSSLRRLYEQSPNARYYNLDIFKYQLHTLPGAKNAPLQLVSHWKCEDNTTNLKIDFKFNSSAFTNCAIQPLKNVQFTANIDANVLSMTSQPEGKWDSLTKQAIWKYNEITQSTTNSGFGSIKAKFDLANGPSSPSSVYVQFSSQETTLSGLEFELIGAGYRLSLIKRQFSSGRYYCEPKVQV